LIDSETHNFSNALKINFECLKDDQINIQGKNCIGEIFGPLDELIIHDFTFEIEKYLYDSNLSKTVVKRTFLLIIEGLQNILRHGHHHGVSPIYGGCLVTENEDEIQVYCMNNIRAEEKVKIQDLIKEINSLPHEALKAKYINVLSTGTISERNGAGLGLMTIRLKAGKPIGCFFCDIDENSHSFTMFCIIDKMFS
jgi:hypothetical protein